MTTIYPEFDTFIIELENNILPIYAGHERQFDRGGIHGRIHVCRAVLFAEWMARYYHEHQLAEVDFDAVRFAIAFHDSGREGNGPDYWEEQSAQRCRDYLLQRPGNLYDATWAHNAGNLILKHGDWNLSRRIVHDADVLEIMRPTCRHGGIDDFRRKTLRFGHFYRDNLLRAHPEAEQLREQLIQAAWQQSKKSRT